MTATIEFGTDGVRGHAGTWPIDTHGAQQIGRGIGMFLREGNRGNSAVIGRDTRQSGGALSAALAAGMTAEGIDVTDVGVMTTAGVAYLARRHALGAAVIVSASHNPWHENGIKVMDGSGFKLGADAESALEEAVNRADISTETEAFGSLAYHPEWADGYIAHLIDSFEGGSLAGLTIALDCSHGAASAIAATCFDALGATVRLVGASPDGTNINEGAGSEAVRAGNSPLYELIAAGGIDLAAAFDGDADRAVFIDDQGRMLDGDHVLYILGRYLHGQGQLAGEAVVTTEMANSGLEIALKDTGIKMPRTNVGDKYILREMQKEGYVLGGEQSGHILIFNRPDHTTGDGILTALMIADILAASHPTTLAELAAPVVKLPQVVASARVAEKIPLEGLSILVDAREGIVKTLGDGVTINTRYSGTELLFRAMVEGRADHSMTDVASAALTLCRAVQAASGLPDGAMDMKDTTTGNRIDLSAL